MGGQEKAKAKAEQAKGKLKENTGRSVGNERMTAEGRAESSQGALRDAKEKAKSSVRKVGDALKND